MEDNKNILAIRIKKMRMNLNLTQEGLALKLGLKGKSSIANYESGNITPSDDIKLKMCEIFDCSMDYLMGKTEFKTKQEELNAYLDLEIRRVIWQTLELFYDDYIIPLQLTEKETGRLVEVLALISGKSNISNSDISNQLRSFLNSFEKDRKEKIKELISIILKEIQHFLGSHEKYYSLAKELEQPTSNVLPIPSNKLYMCPVYGRIAAGVPNWAEQCMEGTLPLDPYMMNIHNPEECFFLRVSGESMNKVIKNGGYALIRKQDEVDNGDIAVVLVNGYDATLKKFTRKNDTIVLEPMSDDESIGIQIYDCTTQIKILGKYIGKFELN